ncbi:hypothetical protein [Halorhabdus amylolytica]|uniref:hypothetical protein n=1 Tax=Halorhabdus amylolytica TaxID=2559573 RepID=UPI0010A99BB8|nr:hypothetical protein [Halorhabdus amylolytica]
MPRLVLSLPTELGPGRTPRSQRAFRTDSRTDYRSHHQPGLEEMSDDRPLIERWLSCWVDGTERR